MTVPNINSIVRLERDPYLLLLLARRQITATDNYNLNAQFMDFRFLQLSLTVAMLILHLFRQPKLLPDSSKYAYISSPIFSHSLSYL